jgi:hypothetical protein
MKMEGIRNGREKSLYGAKGNTSHFTSPSSPLLLTHIFQKGRGILIFCIPVVVEVYLPIALSFSPSQTTFLWLVLRVMLQEYRLFLLFSYGRLNFVWERSVGSATKGRSSSSSIESDAVTTVRAVRWSDANVTVAASNLDRAGLPDRRC